jgi:hypothetical protein
VGKNRWQGRPTPVAPVKALAASTLHRWKKNAPGQLDLALLHELELQADAHVTYNSDVHCGVRFWPFFVENPVAVANCLRVRVLEA